MGKAGYKPKAPNVSTGRDGKGAGGEVVTGNKIQVLLDNQVIGLIQSMQCADDYGVQPATKIGSIEAVEMIPLEANHTLTLSMMMLSKDAVYKASDGIEYVPQMGNNLNQRLNSAIKGLELDIRVVSWSGHGDSNSGKELVRYSHAVYSSGTIDITNNRIVVASATFRATHRSGLFRY